MSEANAGREKPHLKGFPLRVVLDGHSEIKQPSSGYRYSLDPFILADFISEKRITRAIDLGTGNGILALLAHTLHPEAFFMGIDIQREPLAYAKENFAGIAKSVFVQADIRQANKLVKPGSFDLAMSNPPYRKADSGRINPAREKAIARHEIALTLDELAAAASHSLKDGGVFYVVHLAERSAELLHTLKIHSLSPKTIRFVHSREDEDAFLVLVAAVKKGKNPVTVKPPLTVYKGSGGYSQEMKRIYKRFGHEY